MLEYLNVQTNINGETSTFLNCARHGNLPQFSDCNFVNPNCAYGCAVGAFPQSKPPPSIGVNTPNGVSSDFRRFFWPSNSQRFRLHPPKQTWNLKMDPWKRRFLLETIISRFHVNFWGCISLVLHKKKHISWLYLCPTNSEM